MTASMVELLEQESPDPAGVVATIKYYAESGASIGRGLPELLVNTQLSVHQLELLNHYLVYGKFNQMGRGFWEHSEQYQAGLEIIRTLQLRNN